MAGRITELAPQPGYASVQPAALTEDGVAVGDSMAANGWAGRATLWGASGTPVDLPPVPGFPGYAYSSVAAINAHGIAVGYSYGAPGTVTALGFGRPSAVNDAGAVIGGAKYWDPAGNVVPLEGGGTATDLDDAGTAVGSSGFHAAKWDAAGHLTVLDTTWKFSSAAEIGADGTIYGEVVGEDGKSRPARWDPAGRLTVFPAAGRRPQLVHHRRRQRQRARGNQPGRVRRLGSRWPGHSAAVARRGRLLPCHGPQRPGRGHGRMPGSGAELARRAVGPARHRELVSTSSSASTYRALAEMTGLVCR